MNVLPNMIRLMFILMRTEEFTGFLFTKKEFVGGDQSVYINQNGITQLIVYGE